MNKMNRDTKYILAIVGSRRGGQSNTRNLCEKLISAVGEKETQTGTPVYTEILTADKWNLDPCISCGSCFREGICPLDGRDGMGVLKEKIRRADCLMFASPVYAAAVSGDMKRLVDRLSGWLHTMPLIGKTAAVLSTADSNSGESAVAYMRWALETMGAVVAVSLNTFVHYGPLLLSDDKNLSPIISEKADLLIRGMRGELLPTRSQEEYFAMQSKIYEKKRAFGRFIPELRFAEEQIWEEQGYFNYLSMEEIMRRRIGINEGVV